MAKLSEISLFKQFLSKNLTDAQFTEFIVCLYADEGNNIDSFCINQSADNFMFHAFNWEHTPSGFDFWDRTNSEWDNMLYKRTKVTIKYKLTGCKSIW